MNNNICVNCLCVKEEAEDAKDDTQPACANCAEILKFVPARLHVNLEAGTPIYFMCSQLGVQEGTIVGISRCSEPPNLKVRYNVRQYSHEQYDRVLSVDKIFEDITKCVDSEPRRRERPNMFITSESSRQTTTTQGSRFSGKTSMSSSSPIEPKGPSMDHAGVKREASDEHGKEEADTKKKKPVAGSRNGHLNGGGISSNLTGRAEQETSCSEPRQISGEYFKPRLSKPISEIIRHVTDGAVKLTEELELLGCFPKDDSDDNSCCNRALDALYYGVEPESIPPGVTLLDVHNQKALLFHIYNWMCASDPNTVNNHSNHSMTPSKPKLSITLGELLKILTDVPKSVEVLKTIVVFDGCEEDVADRYFNELAKVIQDFLISRVIPRNDLVPIAEELQVRLGSRNYTSLLQLEQKSPRECTIDDLRNLRARIPLSYNEFQIAMQLSYKVLGGSREIFEGHGGGTAKKAVVSDDRVCMYGGMSESFTQSIVERLRISKDSKFVDIGSGIGQVVIQVAATIGCRSAGIEKIIERHNSAIRLRDAFVEILRAAEVEGVQRFVECVDLIHDDVMNMDTFIANQSHIFFNNFGPWFDDGGGDGNKSINYKFQETAAFMDLGTQIITLKCLPEASRRLSVVKFKTKRYSATWNQSELDVFHYTKDKNGWVCGKCTFENVFINEICAMCETRAPFAPRQALRRGIDNNKTSD